MLLPILTLFAIPLTHIKGAAAPPSDRQALHRLDAALNPLSDRKAWFVRVERQLPPTQIPVWQRLQTTVPVNSKAYAELSFMLAYYGVDYNDNLQRLTRPNHLWEQYIQSGHRNAGYAQEYPGIPIKDWVTWGGTWFPLNLLYLKRHDIESLSAWLGQNLDGFPADCSDAELGELWKRHQRDLLRAAYGSDKRLNGLAEALAFEYVAGGDRKAERALLAELSRLENADDPQIAAAARQVNGKVKSQAASWVREAAARKRRRL